MNDEKVKVATVENPDDLSKPEVQADPFAKGRERMGAIGDFFTRTKDRAFNIASNVKGSISRLWTRAKSFGTEAVAATLSADVLAKRGVDYGVEKVADVGEWVGEKVDDANNFACEKTEQVEAFVGRNYERAANFVSTKAESVKKFGQDRIETAKDISFFAKEKTGEALAKAKNGVVNRYNSVKSFGENAILAAKMEATKIKDAYRESMNNLRVRRLEAEIKEAEEIVSENSTKAEMLKQKRDKILENENIRKSLQVNFSI